MRDELLADLNTAQVEAVLHRGSPLLVVAGPGSGKTRVVSRRVAYRVICDGIDPRRIIAITFTARAASEMRDRVASLAGDATFRIGTFHWLCHAILRRYGHRSGHRRTFHLLTPLEARSVLREAARVSAPGVIPGRGLMSAISATKNGISLEAASRQQQIDVRHTAAVLQEYQQRLATLNALDLDDLLREAVNLLREDESLRVHMQHTIEELVVDEYQDTNPVQHQLLECLQPWAGNFIAVGDEDQAIYGWRYAAAEPFGEFERRYPTAKVIVLEQTYRATKHILRAATTLIAHNRGRIEKALRTDRPAGDLPVCLAADDEKDEANWIVREISRILESKNNSPNEIAVLYRVNAQARALEDALAAAGIAYSVVGARRFYERPEVRSVIAALRLSLDPGHRGAAEHLLGELHGVGAKRLEILVAAAGERSLVDTLTDAATLSGLPRGVAQRCAELGDRLQIGAATRARPLAESLGWAIEVARFVHVGRTGDPDADVLEEFRSAAIEAAGPRAAVQDLVERFGWDDTPIEAGTAVRLMSLHGAKGLEFDVVFITGMEEGVLPHHRTLSQATEIEEERRLCYVGTTRARQKLYMTYTHARMLGGRPMVGAPSRFLSEMGPTNLHRISTGTAKQRPRLTRVDVGDRVRHTRWRDGTVVAVEGTGRSTLVTVLFQDVGRRRLQLYHAPLQRLA